MRMVAGLLWFVGALLFGASCHREDFACARETDHRACVLGSPADDHHCTSLYDNSEWPDDCFHTDVVQCAWISNAAGERYECRPSATECNVLADRASVCLEITSASMPQFHARASHATAGAVNPR